MCDLTLADIQQKRETILSIAEQHGAKNIRLFGSVLRGENTATSDIDFLVDPNPDWSLLDLIRLQQALEDVLGCRVDIAQSGYLTPPLESKILIEAVAL